MKKLFGIFKIFLRLKKEEIGKFISCDLRGLYEDSPGYESSVYFISLILKWIGGILISAVVFLYAGYFIQLYFTPEGFTSGSMTEIYVCCYFSGFSATIGVVIISVLLWFLGYQLIWKPIPWLISNWKQATNEYNSKGV